MKQEKKLKEKELKAQQEPQQASQKVGACTTMECNARMHYHTVLKLYTERSACVISAEEGSRAGGGTTGPKCG